MGQWLSWIKSNEKELLTILDNLAKKAVETSEAIVVLFSDLSNVEQSKRIHQLETEADILTRDIFSELNKTFITPLDREEMQRIASKIDDVIDFMDGKLTVREAIGKYVISTFPEVGSDTVEIVGLVLQRFHNLHPIIQIRFTIRPLKTEIIGDQFSITQKTNIQNL